jgi:excisionase family DNA binding protein
MSRTSSKSKAVSAIDEPAVNGVAEREVLTLAEAAAYLRVQEADVLDLVQSQNLSGRLVGNEWRFLKAAIQQWLTQASPTPQSRKEAQLAVVGKYKNDPDLMRIREEALRQRGRPMNEDK